jgi:hypothetical protein
LSSGHGENSVYSEKWPWGISRRWEGKTDQGRHALPRPPIHNFLQERDEFLAQLPTDSDIIEGNINIEYIASQRGGKGIFGIASSNGIG